MEKFQMELSNLSKVGRVFPTNVVDDRIQIDTTRLNMARVSNAIVIMGSGQVLLGIEEKDVVIPPIIRGSKVLDVGAGTGFLAQKIRDTLGCDVYALEPSFESHCSVRTSFDLCVENLGKDHVEKLTLQDALATNPDKYFQAFDVVCVFKYNVPFVQKESFIASLAQVVKPGGVVYITSVERERFIFDGNHHVYLIETLWDYFNHGSFVTRKNRGADQLMTLTGPRLELIDYAKKSISPKSP